MIKKNFNSPKMWYFRRDAWLWNLSDPTMHGQYEPEEIAKFERSLPFSGRIGKQATRAR